MFVLNLVSWAWWRVYQLPFRVVWACIDGAAAAMRAVGRPRHEVATVDLFVALLLALCLMHLWWLYLLLRIAYKLIMDKPVADDEDADGAVDSGEKSDHRPGHAQYEYELPSELTEHQEPLLLRLVGPLALPTPANPRGHPKEE